MSLWSHVACGLVLLILVTVQYASVRTAGFVYEDQRWQAACDLPRSTDWLAWPRRLTQWSWCASRGQSPDVMHVVNVALHLGVMALLGAVLLAVTGSAPAAWAAVLLQSVHRINVETVAYLSSRAELFAAIGVLATCLCAARGWWVFVLPCLAFGMLGKESAIVGMGIVPLVRYAQQSSRFNARLVLAGVMALTLITCAEVWRRDLWLQGDGALTTWAEVSQWALVQASATARLIALMVLPLTQTIDYDYAAVPRGWQIVAVGGLGGLALVAWSQRVRRPLIACGLAWTLIASAPRLLLPTLGSVVNEHQFYLPALGMAFLVAHVAQVKA